MVRLLAEVHMKLCWAVSVLLAIITGCAKPPTQDQVRTHFSRHRAEFELLRDMMLQDHLHFVKAHKIEAEKQLTPQREKEYSRLIHKLGLKEGLYATPEGLFFFQYYKWHLDMGRGGGPRHFYVGLVWNRQAIDNWRETWTLLPLADRWYMYDTDFEPDATAGFGY